MPFTILHKIANTPAIKRFLTENRLFVKLYFNWRYLTADPYNVEKSEFERDKLQRTLEAIKPVGHVKSALEIGCGEGFLTEPLAKISARALGVDISGLVVNRARERFAHAPNIRFKVADILTCDFGEKFDLIACSEVLYYFELAQLPLVVERISDLLNPGGALLLCHARALGDDDSGVPMKKFGAKTIHELFISSPGFTKVYDQTYPMYRITLIRKD
ncbi:MAG: methyltransferase domain-containing protein [Nitrospinae bacterium]|nr:methyltransferase domain-containing protein [Nitrospinota bacterium]